MDPQIGQFFVCSELTGPPSPAASESLELGLPHPKATPWTSKSKVQCGHPVKIATFGNWIDRYAQKTDIM